jgi:hypothetical protein
MVSMALLALSYYDALLVEREEGLLRRKILLRILSEKEIEFLWSFS